MWPYFGQGDKGCFVSQLCDQFWSVFFWWGGSDWPEKLHCAHTKILLKIIKNHHQQKVVKVKNSGSVVNFVHHILHLGKVNLKHNSKENLNIGESEK